jgi:hypothetical protein
MTIETNINESELEPFFFATSTLKLVLMSVFTLGLYELYWFYKNWYLIRKRTDEKIMPFWRAFFAPLWAHSCFKHINASFTEGDSTKDLGIVSCAILYFLLYALWRLPNPYWLVSFLSFLPLIPMNNAAIQVNLKQSPTFDGNRNFSKQNWIGIIIGGVILLLTFIGMMSPDNV